MFLTGKINCLSQTRKSSELIKLLPEEVALRLLLLLFLSSPLSPPHPPIPSPSSFPRCLRSAAGNRIRDDGKIRTLSHSDAAAPRV